MREAMPLSDGVESCAAPVDLPALFRRWAADGEVRADLEEIGLSLPSLSSLSNSSVGIGHPVRQEWSVRLLRLGRAGAEGLSKAAGSAFSGSEAARLMELLADPQCRGLLAARRRWPMALALAGCPWIDPLDPGAAYERMGALALSWLAMAHPGFALRPQGAAPPPGQEQADQARLGRAREAMSALFMFGEGLGLADLSGRLAARAAEQGLRLAFGAGSGLSRSLPREAFAAEFEAMHLDWATRAQAPGPGPAAAAPRL